jgi:hypothetical protein
MTRYAVVVLAILCAGCDNAAERAVRDQLIDPASAEFSEVTSKGNVTCGLVNSKNRMGGYTGRQVFFVRDGQVYFERDSSEVDQSLWSACSSEVITVSTRNLAADMQAAVRQVR